MRLPAQAAPIRGTDYHHVIGWLWVCRMLEDSASISSVCVEDADGGAFDDVVVRRTVEPDLYIQAKSSNYGNETIDSTWLLTSRRPNGKSPLQHFFNTYTELLTGNREFSLELWTNRGFDHGNPLVGDLRDQYREKIDTDSMLAAGLQSRVGEERDLWIEHLGITADQLAEFLAAVRWKHTGSEFEIRRQAKTLMKLVGLRDDDGAVHIGVSVVRGWVKGGRGPQSAAEVVRQAEDLGLITEGREAASAPKSVEESITGAVNGLPPGCRACIESLRLVSPDEARRVASALNQRTSRIPGVLANFVDNPPRWLMDANSLAWDAIVEFSTAHKLPGSDDLREEAIQRGSLRAPLYHFHDAIRAADEGESELAGNRLERIPETYPLFRVAQARINEDDRSVVDTILELNLHESEDLELARLATSMLIIANLRLDDIPQTLILLRAASQRFPERAWFPQFRAELSLASATSDSDRAAEYTNLLEAAVEDALEARDRFRRWRGPSGPTVEIAATALLLLNEPERVCNLATCAPDGEATREEACHPDVIASLANALLLLDRIDQLDDIDIDSLDPPERTRLLALRAHRRNDPSGLTLMKSFLEQATDDAMLLRAYSGLALFGELDDEGLRQLRTADDADKDMIRAMAHFHRGDYATAIDLLRPHCSTSLIHTEMFATAQHHNGATDDAIETLKTAAETRGAVSLYLNAVRLRVEQGRLHKAETLALTALNADVSRNVERELRMVLLDIASQLHDWARMESAARALFRKFPEVPLAPWGVVNALVGQVKPQEAWDFLVKQELAPIDEQTARLAIQVCVGADARDGVAERLLDIATRFSESVEVAGAALATLMILGDEISFTDVQRSLLIGIIDSYVERFPESQVLRAFKVESLDDLQKATGSLTRSQTVHLSESVNRVRNGRVPYGVLTSLCARPYAELVLSLAAGYLTAISLDDEKRETERRFARDAIGGDVTVDTSVAALGIRSSLPADRLASHFRRVLVADELIHDARATVVSVSLSTAEYVVHFPATGDAMFTEITEQQLQQMQDEAARLVDIMHSWQSVPSARIRSPFGSEKERLGFDEEQFRPWDASLRIAAERQVALWCDDLALRILAEEAGIPTFSSYALYEALAADSAPEGLPSFRDIKTQMLRSGIADVPLTWDELSEITGADGTSELAAIRFLDRPFSWTTPQLTLEWYVSRIEALATDADHNRLLELVRAACCGRGMAAGPADSEEAIGEVLAQTLNAVRLRAVDASERIPGVLEASAYACMQVDPSGSLSVLRQALRVLHSRLGEQFGPNLSAGILRRLFAHATKADRNCLEAVILETDA